MIRTIFLPEKIGSYYLFSKRVIGIDIKATSITATVLLLQGKKRIIEATFDEIIETQNDASRVDAVAKVLTKIVRETKKYTAITTALPSEQVIFKTIKLPFTERDKIAKVLPFEIEPLLPFSLQNATLDFLITHVNRAEKSADILVAAVQNESIKNHLEFFAKAGISPDVITIDLFALYGLYATIPAYQQESGPVALIDLEKKYTRIAFIDHKSLRLIRTINKGLNHILKDAAASTEKPATDIAQDIVRFGLEKPDDTQYNNALKEACDSFWKEVGFTLNSFSMQTDKSHTIKLLLLGQGAEIKGVQDAISRQLNLTANLFDIRSLIQEESLTLSQNIVIKSSQLISLSIALPTPATEVLNFRKGIFAHNQQKRASEQLVASGLLLFILITLLGSYYVWQVSSFTKELTLSKREAIAALKERFSDIEGNSLDDVIEGAEEKVAEYEKLYAQTPFLKYLLALSSIIDAKTLGFTIDKLVINKDTIILDAQVKDYEALKLLERDLKKSKLFSYVEPQETTKFIMELRLAKDSEDAQ